MFYMAIKAKLFGAIGSVPVFGWLDSIPVWANLPYPIKGALLRAIKASAAAAVGVILSAATAGTLFPASWGPLIVLVTIPILQAVDKYIREWNIEDGNTVPNTVPVDTGVNVETLPGIEEVPEDTIP